MRVHVVEQNARDAAGEVHKIVVVLQLVFKGGIRQRAALADLVAGQQLFDVVLEIGGLFGGHFHAAAAEYRRIHGGVQHVQNGLMNDDLHGSYLVFIRISLAYSIAQPGQKGESTSCKPPAGMLQ